MFLLQLNVVTHTKRKRQRVAGACIDINGGFDSSSGLYSIEPGIPIHRGNSGFINLILAIILCHAEKKLHRCNNYFDIAAQF